VSVAPLTIPLVRPLAPPADAFGLFRALARPGEGSVFLDSALPDGRLGRWSFVCVDPFLVLSSKGGRSVLDWRGPSGHPQGGPWGHPKGTHREVVHGNPFALLGSLMSRFRVGRVEDSPPLLGGAVGYFAYDLCHFVERLPRTAADDVPVPDCWLAFYDTVIGVNHGDGTAYVASTGLPASGSQAQQRAAQRLDEFVAGIEAARGAKPFLLSPAASTGAVTSNFTRDAYLRAVVRAKEYIAAGDIFQVNLSQRLQVNLAEAPLDLYARLRRLNPAPFAAYLDIDDGAIASASPERFLEIRGRRVQTRPIKGTRPRGATAEQDAALARQLTASIKDRAENVMIVDLERNDLGKVCAYGTVRVTELCALERYATVFHLVSTVEGMLHDRYTAVDCLRACFPGGSITGAPKVRAMEIIDELEPTCRGVYTGAIGYLCFSGDMDLNIVIRTFVIKDGVAYFQVGGGIVADSDPAAEYQETLDKAAALVTAATARREIAIAEG